jgi:exopolysaccharide biosynthesis protein
MKELFFAGALLVSMANAEAGIVIAPWRPIFQGIELAIGTNTPDGNIPRLQVAYCVRVDLADPDVQLFTTPPTTNFVLNTRETQSLIVSNFLKNYGLAVASDANFYNVSPGGSDPTAEGLPSQVFGLQICTGAVVSVPDTGPDANGRYASLMFTTNKQALFVFDNRPPGTNTAGMYTAVSGYYPIVSNGVNVSAAAAISYPDPTIHGPQPRTIHGVSQDRRYLFMMTIDGRQAGYSDGANDNESAIWMIQFGGLDAINMDGGGSTAMYMADCAGNPIAINHSSYTAGRGRERIIGSHFGVFAKPLSTALKDLTVTPADTTAIVEWRTDLPATTQVQYGPTSAYGSTTPLDSRSVTEHIATISGLVPGNTYFYRAVSETGTESQKAGCRFSTTTASFNRTLLFDITNSWKYTTNNLDGVNWQAPSYDDSNWLGPGPGLLHIEDSATVEPKNTLMTPGFVTPIPRTFYFRTHFSIEGDTAGATLTFSNYIDDGAVFYLNGREITRFRMPAAPTVILNSTLAIASPCAGAVGAGDANTYCPDVFTLSGSPITNLVPGDNVMAIEVHNFSQNSPDIVFGLALILGQPFTTPPRLNIAYADGVATLYWNGMGFTLQQLNEFSSNSTNWTDVTVSTSSSPVVITNSGTAFYRLRD